jgi:hypothetical protein
LYSGDEQAKEVATAAESLRTMAQHSFLPGLRTHALIQGIVKVSNGYPKQSLRFLETAHSLNPIESEIIRFLGRMYLYTGREEEEDALEFINKNLRIDISQIFDGMYYVPFPLYSVRLGKTDDGRRKSRSSKELSNASRG